MNPPANSPVESKLQCSLRQLVAAGLALVVALLVALAVVTLVEPVRDGLLKLFSFDFGRADESTRYLGFWLVLGTVLLAILLAWFGRKLSWRVLGAIGAVVAAVLVYLAWDDATLRRPQTFEAMFPAFPGDQASYDVLIRYGKRHPAARDFKGSKLNWVSYDPQKPEPMLKFLAANRAQIEAEWATMTPVRAWWDELNTFPRIADLMPARLDGELLAFSPVRHYAQRAGGIAMLHALEGRGDEAVATVLPLLEVSRKFQLTGRSLVLQMIGLIVERQAMQAVNFTLDRTTVSPALRARLVAALSAPGGGEEGARRLVTVDYVATSNHFVDTSLIAGSVEEWATQTGWVRRVERLSSPFYYNPRATFNLYGKLVADVEDHVGRREFARLEARQKRFLEEEARVTFKNFGGKVLLRGIFTSYSKVAVTYWKAQDERAALLARVNAPPAATP